MDSRKLRERLMATFLAELESHVRTLGDSLLRLEQQPDAVQDAEFVKELFRSAHSLKGAAHAVEVPAVEAVCHAMEDVFARIRDDGLRPTSAQISVLLQALDVITSVAEALQAGHETSEETVQSVCERIRSIVATSSASPEDSDTPSDNTSAQDVAEQTESAETRSKGGQTRQAGEEAAAEALERTSVAAVEGATGESPDRETPDSPRSAADESVAEVRSLHDAPVAGAARTPRGEPRAAGEGSDGELAAGIDRDEQPSRDAETRRLAFVHVAAEKLDDLMDQAGELLTACQRIESHPAVLSELCKFVEEWRDQWRASCKHIQRTLELAESSGALGATSRQSMLARQTVEAMSERLAAMQQKLSELYRRAAADARQLHQVTRNLQEEVHHVRMFPFEEACVGLQRAARDIALECGKQVRLQIVGGDTEVDRSVLEALREPLLHLVRNAVDHGIETPQQRQHAGKPAEATVVIEARPVGGMLKVDVRDDGRGIDLQKVRKRSRRLNLPETDDPHELLQRIFRTGFSTAEIITNISGRGIGLDVVKSRLERLGGTISVRSELGRGTCFTATVPLSLATVEALLLRVADQIFAIPTTAVVRLLHARPEDFSSVGGRQMLRVAEGHVPIVRLADVLGLDEQAGAMASGTRGLLTAVVQVGDGAAALIVDEVLSDREVVVKGFGTRIRSLRFYSGATLLSDGQVALVLNPATVIRAVREGRRSTVLAAPRSVRDAPQRLLVVEDSVTTRALMKGILESAGYEVTTAVDGQDAWERLQKTPVDLVVSDVDMPRMDGFELTRTIRSTPGWEALPVVLVTSRATEEDKRRGVEVGANAYLTKSEFDQTEVLEIIRRLV